jgi:hypothetical protein
MKSFNNLLGIRVYSVLIALGLASAPSLLAESSCIYSNASNDLLNRFNPGTLQVGDQIILAGTERYLTQFDFEFWGTNTLDPANLSFDGTVEARVRFYGNNGPDFNGYATPGPSSFYDSGWFGGFGPTPRSILIFTAGSDFAAEGLYLPFNEMTWSVEFRGMTASDSVGVDIYSPPTIGANYPDYWEYDGASWALKTNGVPMDFGARMYATVPEPSVVTLLLAGGAVLALVAKLRRRQ